MENIEISCFIDNETHSANINKLFHIGMQLSSWEIKDFLEEISEEQYVDMLSDNGKFDYIEGYLNDGEIIQMFLDHGLYGYVAELYLPCHSDFSFHEDGSFSGCSVHSSDCIIEYVYAETIEELLNKVMIESEKAFQSDMNKFKKI